MKLKTIQKKLKKLGIAAEIKDFSLDDNITGELWDKIGREIDNLKEWNKKRDIVMIAIISKRLKRLSQRVIEEKDGKVFRLSITTNNAEGQERVWKFCSVSDLLRLWWCGLAEKLPDADDHVLGLILDSRIQMVDCCFKEVISALEKAYWSNSEEVNL